MCRSYPLLMETDSAYTRNDTGQNKALHQNSWIKFILSKICKLNTFQLAYLIVSTPLKLCFLKCWAIEMEPNRSDIFSICPANFVEKLTKLSKSEHTFPIFFSKLELLSSNPILGSRLLIRWGKRNKNYRERQHVHWSRNVPNFHLSRNPNHQNFLD